MGIHDGRELNRPVVEFTLDPDTEPFPIAVYRVSDEVYPTAILLSSGTWLTGDGSAYPV